MKALEKDRTRRYGSANEFAKDVQRYLDDEPVEACPPSTSYRLKKFANRNRAMITFAALLLLTLLAGIAATTWQAAQAIQARKVAEAEQQRAETAAANEAAQRKEAERQQQIAQENFERARDAVDEYLTRVSQEELLNTPGLQPLRKDLLELALKYYQEFVAERSHDQTLQADLAAAYSRVGDITSEIGSKERLRHTRLGFKSERHSLRKNLTARSIATIWQSASGIWGPYRRHWENGMRRSSPSSRRSQSGRYYRRLART